jgi:hypothetical protein
MTPLTHWLARQLEEARQLSLTRHIAAQQGNVAKMADPTPQSADPTLRSNRIPRCGAHRDRFCQR